jgi:Uncharacterized membrane protein (homolog of Drosophila rhomboid)
MQAGYGCCSASDTILEKLTMRRPASNYGSSFSFGPGPLSTSLKALIGANVAMFVLTSFMPSLQEYLGLVPALVLHQFWVWQLATYMFLHGGLFHILFNMLALWMFGTELERIWGTRYFLKFYFLTGIGAGALTVVFSLLPFGFSQQVQHSVIIGASGAIYGLLLAYALYFPDRPILMIVFWVPARSACDSRRHCAADLALGGGRHRERDARRRPGRRLSAAEGGADTPHFRTEVPLPEVEDQPRPQEVRRLLGRPRQRLRSPRALNAAHTRVTFSICHAHHRWRADPRRRAAGTRHRRSHRLESLEL